MRGCNSDISGYEKFGVLLMPELAERPQQHPSASLNAENHSEQDRPGTNAFESSVTESALPPVDEGYRAWSFLAGAFFVQAFVFGFQNAYGVFLEAYLRDPVYASQKNAGTLLPLIGSLGSGITYCSGPFVYPLVARYPHLRRHIKWIGALLCSLGLFGASYATSVPSLVALQGITYSVGGAILYTPCLSYLSEWFVRRRGLASGIMFAGGSIGGLFLPLILPKVIEQHGTSITLRYLAIATFCMLMPCLPFVQGRLPNSRIRGPAVRSRTSTWTSLRQPSMVAILVIVTLQGFGFFVPILWLPTFGSTLLSSGQSSVALALLNGGSVCGRLLLGFGADKFDPWLLALLTLSSTSLSTFVFWGVLGYTYAGLIVYGLLYGILAGGFSSLFNAFLRPIVKDDPGLNTSLLGYMMLSRGMGNVLSSPISAVLASGRDEAMKHAKTGFAVAGGRYEGMIIYTGTCFAGAAVIALASWGVGRWARIRESCWNPS